MRSPAPRIRNFGAIATGIAAIWLMSAVVPAVEQTAPAASPPAADPLLSAVERWTVLFSVVAPTRDAASTSIPERGVRGKYWYLRSVLSIRALEAATGERAFASGPHGADPGFASMTSFGRYRPEFVAAIRKQVARLLSDDRASPIAAVVYGSSLRGLARTYYSAYVHLSMRGDRDVILREYEAHIAAAASCRPGTPDSVTCSPSSLLAGRFAPFSRTAIQAGYDSYEASVAPGFWVRRAIDGTDHELFAMLRDVIEKFDRPFLERLDGRLRRG